MVKHSFGQGNLAEILDNREIMHRVYCKRERQNDHKVSAKRRLGVGVGVGVSFFFCIFFGDLFGNRFLLVEKVSVGIPWKPF